MPKPKTLKIKTKRQLDPHNAADRAVLEHRARRAEAAMADTSDVRPPTAEEIERFAVGGCGGDCKGGCQPVPCMPPAGSCQPNPVNACYHEVAHKHGCALKVASGGQLSVDGHARIAFVVEPKQSNFFLPLKVRLSARLRDDPDQRMVWLLTAVMVNSKPQENYHEPNPTAETMMLGVESSAYEGKSAGDVPGFEVAWGPFSREAQANHLQLVGWNPYSVGMAMHVRAEIWGYELDGLPNGWQCGKHPGKPSLDGQGMGTPSNTPAVG